jgi:NAD-dependent dihydropyrimidine dehydrogenase PreA subunit
METGAAKGVLAPKPARIVKEKAPGLFAPVVDRRVCEGGHHHVCADQKTPCVPACPYEVLQILPLTRDEKRALALGDRLRAWVHGNRQAHVVRPEACTGCGRCVEACPVKHVLTLRRRVPAGA